MAKSDYSTIIAIDMNRSLIHFYSSLDNDNKTIDHQIKSFSGGQIDDNFFTKFKKAIKEYAENTPSESVRKVAVILPDNAVLTDTVRIPTIKGLGQTKKALEATLSGLYRNYNNLTVVSQVAEQNKQFSTYTIMAVRKDIVSSIYAVCSENKMLVDTLTCASAAAVNGASLVNTKVKTSSYLLLDIKDTYTRFVFVVKGAAVGSYTLPFGYEFLRKPKVTQEDMLFDHSYAEITVINAREKAKAKKLTLLGPDDESDEDQEDEEAIAPVFFDESDGMYEDEDEEDEEEFEVEERISDPLAPRNIQKFLNKKTPRKLPKFMQREIPETREGVLYENFRVFVKWALTLIQENSKLTELGKPEAVYVNIPKAFIGVFEEVNKEAEENGILFTPLTEDSRNSALSNLELYGALFARQIPRSGRF